MWIVDTAMHELLQRKIILAEEMGVGGASYILDYENLRHTDEEPICWIGPGL